MTNTYGANAKKDVTSLTGLRGVAALYVVIHHYYGSAVSQSTLKTFLGHGYLAVDLFFVLSGFVMALNYQHMFMHKFSISTYFTFMGRRFARIYPIYFISTAAGMILILLGWNEFVKAGVSSSGVWALKFILNALLVQSWGLTNSINDPTWSLSAEWAAYIVFPALLIPCLFRKAVVAWAAAFVSVGWLIVLCISPLPGRAVGTPLDLTSYHYAIPVLRCLPEFTLGILSFRLSSTAFGRQFRADRFISLALCIAIFILLLVPKTDLFIALLFPFLVVSLASGATHIPGRVLSSALADLLGRLSYSIYLIHTLIGLAIPAAEHKLSLLGLRPNNTVSVLTALALTFVLAYLSYTYIEVPGRIGLRALFEGRAEKRALA